MSALAGIVWPRGRAWLAAVGLGVGLGFLGAMEPFTGVWHSRPTMSKLGVMLPILSRWSLMLAGAACLTLLGFTLLRELERRGRLKTWHHVALVVAVVVVNALTFDILAFAVLRWSHVALKLPWRPFWMTLSWWDSMLTLWIIAMPSVLVMVSMASFALAYNLRARRTAAALANAQLRLTQAERRALAEQLHGAQASVEPEFLFATLAAMAACFETEPQRAGRLLDALIRFLRAALPAHAEQVCTLGQQAELMTAYLDIETLRAGGRLTGRVDVPEALREHPFAPLLLLPLLRDAVARGARDVTVRVTAPAGRLCIEAEDDGSPPGSQALLDELQRRLRLLYGEKAGLWREGRVTRLEINDTERP